LAQLGSHYQTVKAMLTVVHICSTVSPVAYVGLVSVDVTESGQRGYNDRLSSGILENECDIRKIIPERVDRLKRHSRNLLPEGSYSSFFLHGDQGIVSDILDFDADGRKTGTI
jgi:hypothetical protein